MKYEKVYLTEEEVQTLFEGDWYMTQATVMSDELVELYAKAQEEEGFIGLLNNQMIYRKPKGEP